MVKSLPTGLQGSDGGLPESQRKIANSGKAAKAANMRGSAQSRAYALIRGKILSGEFAVGGKLKPGHIAKVLGVSRMPVREALLQLDAEGLVTARTNYSAVVTSLTLNQIEEIFEMRAALESLAARLALPHFNEDSLIQLETLLSDMAKAASDGQLWIKRHGEFHDCICAKSGRPRLAEQVRHLRTWIQPYLLIYINNYYSPELEGSAHDALLVALRTGNSLLVESVFRDHVLNAAGGLIRFMRQQGRTRTKGAKEGVR
jgi:DNA-binding GntR family transcriptional regulator